MFTQNTDKTKIRLVTSAMSSKRRKEVIQTKSTVTEKFFRRGQ